MHQLSNIHVLAAVCTIGGGLFGFDISSMSVWVGNKSYLEYFNYPDQNLQGSITASMLAGCWLGALVAGWMSDRFGRRMTLLIASLLWIAGSGVTCSVQNISHLIAGRIMNGFSVGMTSSQAPVYLAELSNKNIRGRVIGIQQWAVEWGVLVLFSISYGCSFIAGSASFRLAWGLQAAPAALLFSALLFFPESPRWLASQDRWEETLQVLAHLHSNGDQNDPLVIAEYNEVKESMEASTASVGWSGLFQRDTWKFTVAAVFGQTFQQTLGGNVMMYYLVYVLKMAGFTGNINLFSSSIKLGIFLLTTCITLAIIDRVGRRPLFIYGGIAMSVLNFCVAGLMANYGKSVDGVDGNSNVTWQVTGNPAKGILAATYLFVAVYGLTWGPCTWIYVAEVFPVRLRAKGVGLASSVNWLLNFSLAYIGPPTFRYFQWRTYIIFGIFCLCGVVHAFIMFPETRGKTLEEVEGLFEHGAKAWKSSHTKSRLDIKLAGDEKTRPVAS